MTTMFRMLRRRKRTRKMRMRTKRVPMSSCWMAMQTMSSSSAWREKATVRRTRERRVHCSRWDTNTLCLLSSFKLQVFRPIPSLGIHTLGRQWPDLCPLFLLVDTFVSFVQSLWPPKEPPLLIDSITLSAHCTYSTFTYSTSPYAMAKFDFFSEDSTLWAMHEAPSKGRVRHVWALSPIRLVWPC